MYKRENRHAHSVEMDSLGLHYVRCRISLQELTKTHSKLNKFFDSSNTQQCWVPPFFKI